VNESWRKMKIQNSFIRGARWDSPRGGQDKSIHSFAIRSGRIFHSSGWELGIATCLPPGIFARPRHVAVEIKSPFARIKVKAEAEKAGRSETGNVSDDTFAGSKVTG